jgi:hypothetical protein
LISSAQVRRPSRHANQLASTSTCENKFPTSTMMTMMHASVPLP